MAPFRRRGAWDIQSFADFVQRFNSTVPRHELGEGNAALVIVRNGTVKVQWLRGKDNHWRVSVRHLKAPFYRSPAACCLRLAQLRFHSRLAMPLTCNIHPNADGVYHSGDQRR